MLEEVLQRVGNLSQEGEWLANVTFLVDLIEAKIGPSGVLGVASQSIQLAPMDPHYAWINTTPEVTFYNNLSTTYQK